MERHEGPLWPTPANPSEVNPRVYMALMILALILTVNSVVMAIIFSPWWLISAPVWAAIALYYMLTLRKVTPRR